MESGRLEVGIGSWRTVVGAFRAGRDLIWEVVLGALGLSCR